MADAPAGVIPPETTDDPAKIDRKIEKACVAVVLRAVQEGDVQTAKWVLERKYARRWGPRR